MNNIKVCLIMLMLAGCGLAMSEDERLERGEQALAAGDPESALVDAKDVVRRNPDNLRGRLLLGHASIAVGDGPTAEKELRRAIELGASIREVALDLGSSLLMQGKNQEILDQVPVNSLPTPEAQAAALRLHGEALLRLNRPEDARDAFTKALRLDPENLDAQLGVVMSYVAEGSYAQARGTMDQILENNPDNPRAWLSAGTLSIRARDFDTAEANFRAGLRLIDESDDSVSGLALATGLAETLIEQGEIDEARAIVDDFPVSSRDSLEFRWLNARLQVAEEDWDGAEQNLQQLLRAVPNYRPAQMLIGVVHLQNGNLAQAEMYLSSAVNSIPNDIYARQLLAETRLRMRKSAGAEEALLPIISDPNADTQSLRMAVRASLDQSNPEQAIELLNRIIAAEPDNLDARFQLVMTLLRSGRSDEAQEALDSIDAESSEDVSYTKDAFRVLSLLNDQQFDEALALAGQVAEAHPDRPEALNLLGAVQLMGRNFEAARRSLEASLEMNPEQLIPRRTLAEIYASSGEFDAALEQYNEILESVPDATWAVAAIGKIAFVREDFPQAAARFSEAFDAEPDNVDHLLNLVSTELRLDDRERGISLLEANAELVGDSLPASIMLAALKLDSGDSAAAGDIAERLLRDFPDSPASHAFAGEVEFRAGNIAAADEAYDEAVALGPVRAHVVRSYQIKRDNGIADAAQPLRSYLDVQPMDNDVRALLAESLLGSNDLDAATAAYERVVAEQPDNAVALNNLAWTYFMADDPRAIETGRRAYELAPDNGSVVDTLGWIILHQGSAAEAVALLEKAAELEPEHAEIRYHYAVSLARTGSNERAREILSAVLAGNEDFAGRREAEELMESL